MFTSLRERWILLFITISAICLLYIVLPVAKLISNTDIRTLIETARDNEVINAIGLSLYASFLTAVISFVIGTPIAYLIARFEFRGKKLVESILDIPVVIPHTTAGIALLNLFSPEGSLGAFLENHGIRILGSVFGIICAMLFVSLPLYIGSAKDGFKAVSSRYEKVARSLGASFWKAFFYITIPLSWRHLLTGMTLCGARAISEFGAVVVIAYYPMTAPILVYHRFEGYGLAYSRPVAVLLILVCLASFLLLRWLSLRDYR